MALEALQTFYRSCQKRLSGCFAGKVRPLPANLFKVYSNGRLAAAWWDPPGPARYKKYSSPCNIGNQFNRLFNEGFQDARKGRQPRYKLLKREDHG